MGCVVCSCRISVELPQEVFFQKIMAARGKEYLVLEQNCVIVVFQMSGALCGIAALATGMGCPFPGQICTLNAVGTISK